jgi:hypothetical protein
MRRGDTSTRHAPSIADCKQAGRFQHDVGFAQTGKGLNQLAAIVTDASKR